MHCIVMGLGYPISFPLAFVSVLFPFSLLFIAILASVCFFFPLCISISSLLCMCLIFFFFGFALFLSWWSGGGTSVWDLM